MGNTVLTRQAVERAAPLDFTQTCGERQANIQIEASPGGLVVRVEFTGPIASIPAVIERLKAAGILELVEKSHPAAQGRNTKAQRVQPGYALDGSPVCPEHDTKLREGKWGLYCPHKDKASSEYCKLKFLD